MFSTAKDNSAKDNRSNLSKDDMLNEGGHAFDDAKDAARRFKDEVRDAGTGLRDDLEMAARRTGRHVRDMAESAEHNIEDVGEAMTRKIRQNPIQSSLIALSAGFVIGMLYKR
ncbi:MAG: hypothetical protein WCD70_07535 [Alphaproteobacteria bacterium]